MTLSDLSKSLQTCLFTAVALSFSLFGTPAAGQAEPAPASADAAPAPAIWEIRDDDTTIYLFGTVHILTRDTVWRTAAFDELWAQADTVYFETDISPEAQADLQALIFEYALNRDGTTLSSFLSEADAEFVKAEVEKLGLRYRDLEPYRPWFASISISVMQILNAGGDPEAGVDMILSGEARAEDKELRFFESGEEQILFLAGMSDETAATMLVEGLRQTKENPDFFATLVSTWQRGETEALAELLTESMAENAPELAEALLYRRNEHWAGVLSEVMQNEAGVFFVAVGAGHLAGEKSVQDYLAEQGYSANRR